jgi:hypothetical protein
MATEWTLTFDCAHATAQAEFWRLALDYVAAPPPKGFGSWRDWLIHYNVPEDEWDDVAAIKDPAGIGPRISFLKVPEGKTAKNRIHLDLQAGGGRSEPIEARWPRVLAKVDQLTAAGATVLRRDILDDGTPDHVVLADPEGNEFCVV